MGHHAAHLGDQPRDGDEHRRPTGIGEGGHQNIAFFHDRVLNGPDHTGPAFHHAGRHPQTGQRPGGDILLVSHLRHLAVRKNDPRRGEIGKVGIVFFAAVDVRVIHLACLDCLLQLFQVQVEDVAGLLQDTSLRQALCLSHNRSFVDIVTADPEVLGILPCAHIIAEKGDIAAQLFGLAGTQFLFRQGCQFFRESCHLQSTLFKGRLAVSLG